MRHVWDINIPFENRFSAIQSKIDELWKVNMDSNGELLKSLRKLKLDFYYQFSTDLDKIQNWSRKYKQLVLARSVIKIVRNWDRKYTIDLEKRISGEFFIKYFKDTMETTKYHLCCLGINWYKQETYTLKTFILWASKMKKLGFIGKEKLNSFLQELERLSYGK